MDDADGNGRLGGVFQSNAAEVVAKCPRRVRGELGELQVGDLRVEGAELRGVRGW